MIKSRSNPIITTVDKSKLNNHFSKPGFNQLFQIFKKNNFELRIVGGAVRDFLLGKEPNDLDFATNATMYEMKRMFDKQAITLIHETKEKYGIITAKMNDKEVYEITTLKINIASKTGRKWEMDASTRDLTINAMFLDLSGNVYDYFYGFDDLKKKKVVFVGNPVQRIRADYLRIFRYFRFYGLIADHPNNHDNTTINAIKQTISGLNKIHGERIWSEWEKILNGNYGCEITLKLIECGISPHCGLPANPNIEEFKRVYHECSKKNVSLRPITLVTLLLENVLDVLNLHTRLKLPDDDRDLAFFLIREHVNKTENRNLQYYQNMKSTKIYISELIKCNCNFDYLSFFT
ncbi:CCA tRNA nucleotidyltransferase 1, mitochondrial-like [Prorops nasuta]|uniref:CCA tRNA nucleotidyltransferase 1, mitochondrial-like n=1 Tax=Prorops nasuta TaxID=863751 RepID=UPI0034CDEA9D